MKRVFAAFFVIVSFLTIPVSALEASAYIVIEQSTGRVLYEANADSPMPMASTTKVMTAVLVIENLDLAKEYDIPDGAVGIPGSSIYLKKGEKLTGEELLYGLMLASGNDAAYALAELTSGSVEAFVEKMNQKAVELGLEHTRFADPCGLAAQNHYTSARDLAVLCAYALNNEIFARVVATQNYQIPGAEEGTLRYLHNKNRILGECLGGNGIKTGYTRAAGRCLCSSATRNGMQLICVTLNDYNWFNDSKTLLEKGFAEYTMVSLFEENKVAGVCNILDGTEEKCDIICKTELAYPLKKGEKLSVVTDVMLERQAPVSRGEKAGEIRAYLNGEQVASSECVFYTSVEKKMKWFGR